MSQVKTSYARMKLAMLNVCNSYQRPVVRAQVNKIKKNYCPEALGSLLVAHRQDNTYHVVDGQQRKVALQEMGHESAPCEIFESHGPCHEAEVFIHANKHRTGVHSLVIYHARLMEGDPVVADIDNLLVRYGFYVPKNKGLLKWPEMRAVGACERVVKRGGLNLLEAVLMVITQAWKGEDEALRGDMIEGLAELLHAAVNLDPNRLVRKLSQTSPTKVMRDSTGVKEMLGGNRKTAFATVLLNAYNHKAQKHRATLGQR